jgi:Hexokinase
VRWTKGFDVSDGVGHDPVQCLQGALRSLGWAGQVSALVNDAVAVLGAARYKDPDTCISVILGTGALWRHDVLGCWTGPVCTAKRSTPPQRCARRTSSCSQAQTLEQSTPLQAICVTYIVMFAGTNASYVEHGRAVGAMFTSPDQPMPRRHSLAADRDCSPSAVGDESRIEDNDDGSAGPLRPPPPATVSTAGFALSSEDILGSTNLSASMELHDPMTVVNMEWGGFASAHVPRCGPPRHLQTRLA